MQKANMREKQQRKNRKQTKQSTIIYKSEFNEVGKMIIMIAVLDIFNVFKSQIFLKKIKKLTVLFSRFCRRSFTLR